LMVRLEMSEPMIRAHSHGKKFPTSRYCFSRPFFGTDHESRPLGTQWKQKRKEFHHETYTSYNR
jgi:hypothetical protein